MNMEKATSAIRNAWIAGAISGVLTMIVALIGAFGYDLWSLIDAFLILGLSFGIYKKNRACAVILFIYLVINLIALWILVPLLELSEERPFLPLWIIIGILFLQGIRGTFAYHRITRTER